MHPPLIVYLLLTFFIFAPGMTYAEDDSGNISWTERGGDKIVHILFSGNEVVYFTQTRELESGAYETDDQREGVVSDDIMDAFISDLLALRVLEWDQRYPADEDFICATELWSLGLRLQQGTVSSLGYCMEAPNFGEVAALFENLATHVADR